MLPGLMLASLLTVQAMAHHEIKRLFETYDMVPGPKARQFVANLKLHGGKCDAHGYSLIDCLLRADAGAVDAGGAPVGGVPMILVAGGGVAAETARRLRRARLKESYTYITSHICDRDSLLLFAEPPYFGVGPLVMDYVMANCVVLYDAVELSEMKARWTLVEIVSDVGVSENTIRDALKLLRSENALKFAVIRLMVRCVLVPTTAMIADIFTKPVDEETFYRMRDIMRNLAVWVPEPTAKVNRLLGALRRAMSVGSFS